MLRNAIAQEIPTSLAPAVADPISFYYCLSVAVIISAALIVKLLRWWWKDD